MDSKRKVNGGTAVPGEDADDRAAKRRKLPHDHADLSQGETPETTTHYGLRLLDTVRKTEDKSGRPVATNFLTLPNRRQLPDYYRITRMPIALDTIEAKLTRHEFPSLSTLESYFKRMIANAKEYNQKGSEIYDDAERIRKALSNFMTKNNPAYKTPGYVAYPTPIPDEAVGDDSGDDGEDEPGLEVEVPTAKRKPGRPPKNLPSHAQRLSTTPTVSETQYAGVSFSGLTFQQAQEKIVSDMISHKDDPEDEFAAFEPFVNLPPRSLRDYYQVIPNPVSLKKLQKRVRGIHGRNDPTNVSDFKTWAAFEEETSYIWKNAWHYNEDGSDISNLAKELETFFNKSLQEAKQAVAEPAGPKIKLKMPDPPPRITLKLGGKASPADSPTPQPNGSSSSNGNGAPTNGTARRIPFGNTYSLATPNQTLDQLERTRSMSGSVSSPTPSASALIKNEDGARNSPTVPTASNVPSLLSGYHSYRGTSHAVSTPGFGGSGMLPPSTPGISNHNYPQSAYAQTFNHHSQYHAPNPSFESKWRQPGKDASNAMITNLSIATHPGLNISRHFRLDLPPSPTMAQQSITVNLPSTHYYLQIKPTIAASLLERQYKLFVTSGTQRLHAMPTIPGHSVDLRHPLFEARLLPGVNRIEVELIAALPKGATKPAHGQDVELEKIIVFANLMRS